MTCFSAASSVALALAIASPAAAGQVAAPAMPDEAPRASTAPEIPVSSRDRVYAAEQFSNTVSVIDPHTDRLLGVIRLGEPQPANFSPLYRGQVLVHGMGYAPDGRTIAVVSIGSNGVSFVDTATNRVKHTTYVGRSPHEAFYTPDGREVWVTIRGEDYVAVLDAASFQEIARIKTPGGPGMTIFSPDGQLAYVCSSFNPVLVVFDVASRKEVSRVAQPSPFCPNIAATRDARQVWYTLKDVGKTVVIDAKPPFATLRIIDTGPITNHVNFVDSRHGKFAYVTVGGLNEVQVFRRDNFAIVARIPVGELPHGIWPSGDGTRVYVGLENGDAMVAIDTRSNKVVAKIPIGQAAQAVNYVPNAVPAGDGLDGLQLLGIAGNAVHLTLGVPGLRGKPLTSVSLFDQGLVQVLEAGVTGLTPKTPYVLGLATSTDGTGSFAPLAAFTTNAAGAAIVNTTGPIRTIVQAANPTERRYLTIVSGTPGASSDAIQVQQD